MLEKFSLLTWDILRFHISHHRLHDLTDNYTWAVVAESCLVLCHVLCPDCVPKERPNKGTGSRNRIYLFALMSLLLLILYIKAFFFLFWVFELDFERMSVWFICLHALSNPAPVFYSNKLCCKQIDFKSCTPVMLVHCYVCLEKTIHGNYYHTLNPYVV